MQNGEKNPDVSVLNWMGTQLLMCVPVVNLIMLVVWAITGKKKSKRNFAIAGIILTVIAAALLVLAIWYRGPQILEWIRQWDQALPSASRG